MSMTRCYECETVCATSARHCPKCGANNPSLGRIGNTVLRWATIISIPFGVIGIGIFAMLFF